MENKYPRMHERIHEGGLRRLYSDWMIQPPGTSAAKIERSEIEAAIEKFKREGGIITKLEPDKRKLLSADWSYLEDLASV